MSLPERLSFYGQNTGNLLFAEALFQVVENSRFASYHFKPQDIESADVVVVAAANWINPHSDFGNLASRLKSFGKPVVLVGIGIQASDAQSAEITPGTRALLDLAAETSTLISVRGYETETALKRWGYSDVAATGCPSLLLSNGRFTSHAFQAEATRENTVLMGTRHLLNPTSHEQNQIYKIAFRNKTDIIMQSELADMYFIEDLPRVSSVAWTANKILKQSYGVDDIDDIRRYLGQYGKVFFHAKEWRRYLQSKEYVVGTRIHGTIATILSGRRGILLSHDCRTAELAEIMGIPHVSLSGLEPLTFQVIVDLIEETDFDVTRRAFAEYQLGFAKFFRQNGIAMRSPSRSFGE